MPRDVDPEVRRGDGILLCDLEGLARVVKGYAGERTAIAAAADKIVAEEALAFRARLKAERVVPTIVALRHRLDEISQQELESFISERGPFTREQDQSLHAITAQILQRIASSLARELKELPEKKEHEHMAGPSRGCSTWIRRRRRRPAPDRRNKPMISGQSEQSPSTTNRTSTAGTGSVGPGLLLDLLAWDADLHPRDVLSAAGRGAGIFVSRVGLARLNQSFTILDKIAYVIETFSGYHVNASY